jgi:hypothetical protein
MAGKMRRNFSDAFAAIDCGNGAWRLTSEGPREVNVYLKDAEPGAAQAFGAVPISSLAIEWHPGAAHLSFQSGGSAATVQSAVAIVHEPLRSLYDGLPLATVDADTRRFWRRVFRIVRMPGGRYLLKLLARRKR